MAIGTIKWFNENKGYGFIKPDNGDGDIFMHNSALEKAGITVIREGMQLSYEVAVNKGRKSAVNLKQVDPLLRATN
jgi:CspA family cold shock protein